MMIDTTTGRGDSSQLTGSRRRVAAEVEPLLVTTPPPSYADDYPGSPPLSSGGFDAGDDVLVYKDHPTRQRTAFRTSSSWSYALLALVPILITAASFFTRFYKLSFANFVVWDEAHFGKFASYYIKQSFYSDVHPPLGKMLNGFAGLLAGYDGDFEFGSGAKYPRDVNYTIMRALNALFGALVAPLAYYTARNLKLSHASSALAAVMVICDAALCCISRFILLDSMLLFCTSLVTYCLCVSRNTQRTQPFSEDWFWWMCLTGVSLGVVLSVKWVGLFAIALVGLHTIEDLWELLGDLKLTWKQYGAHWLTRIVFLILVPIGVYMLSFWLHFAILQRSGPGDAQMSSLFQAQLIGNDFDSNPLEIAYGSIVSFKNNAGGGGLLHSHVQTFPYGSKQQQVTCYHHKDANNEWQIMKPWRKNQSRIPEGEILYVKDGDVVALQHVSTGKHLHSHQIPAPLTNSAYEVSAYGGDFYDPNDEWRVEKVNDIMNNASPVLQSLTTRFRFRHIPTGCLLRSSAKTLPEWGFKQTEVVCQKKGDNYSEHNIWNVEKHINANLTTGSSAKLRQGFLRSFVDLNIGMWNSNNALTPDPDKFDELVSKPWQWPLALVGLRMCGWGDNETKFFLIGTPVIWWGTAASLVGLVFLHFVYAIRARRGYIDFAPLTGQWNDFYFATKVGILGWFLHYIPFWIMGRVTYLHHYFPALYFGIIAFCVLVDHLSRRLIPRFHIAFVAVLMVVCIWNFWFFSDYVFGLTGPAKEHRGRKWLSTWNMYDE